MSDATFFADQRLEADITALQSAIKAWAVSHDIWYDCGFKTYLEHVKGEPSETEPVICIQYFSSEFQNMAVYGDLESEFSELVRSHGLHYEYATAANLHFYADEGPRCDAYARYFRWQWVCSLVREDFSDVYEELYAHFAARPEDLYRLGWREFEILLARIFQAQGFETCLGPGQGDGGVDIRLLQRDPIGDILTLVQAKKYAPKRNIGLQAVQALYGAATADRAQQSIFVTTSAYQPAAKKFAARLSGQMQLSTSGDVAAWCRTARDGIIKDKSSLVLPHTVERLLLRLKEKPDRRVLHTSFGFDSVHNSFAVILKETKHAALLMQLPKQVLPDDGYGQRGTEVPLFDATAPRLLHQDTVWRAHRRVGDDGQISFWDGRNLFHSWDRQRAGFNYYD